MGANDSVKAVGFYQRDVEDHLIDGADSDSSFRTKLVSIDPKEFDRTPSSSFVPLFNNTLFCRSDLPESKPITKMFLFFLFPLSSSRVCKRGSRGDRRDEKETTKPKRWGHSADHIDTFSRSTSILIDWKRGGSYWVSLQRSV